MALLNPAKQFFALLPQRPLMVGTVSAVDGAICTVSLPGGGSLQARGTGWSTSDRVFVRDGVIEGEAPSLTYVEAEV